MRSSLAVCLLLFPVLAAAQPPIKVTAKAIGPLPGAVVCQNMAAVTEAFDLYAEHWEESIQAGATGGASSRVNGSPLPAPNLQRMGCALAKPGTVMTLESGGGVGIDQIPVVSFRTSKGRLVRGVTQSNMYDAPTR
jgi:hypothetical protein